MRTNLKISKNSICMPSESSHTFENSSNLVVQHTSHKFTISNNFNMEADCADPSKTNIPSTAMDDVFQMLAALSAQITSQNMKISSEISQVVHTNDDFKWEVRTD